MSQYWQFQELARDAKAYEKYFLRIFKEPFRFFMKLMN